MSHFTILGGTGQIGRALAAYLRSAGEHVHVPDRTSAEIYDQPLGHVIYAIGVTADFRSRPIDTMQAHVCVLSRVLREAQFDSLLYLSSTRVYSGSDLATEGSTISVNPCHPSDLYNISKLAGESLCLHSGRPKVRVARLSNVVGGDDAASPNFLPSLVREARAGLIRLHSSLESSKDYVHIDDVSALLTAIVRDGTHPVYNVASGRPLAHKEIVERLQQLYACRVEVDADAPFQRFPPISIERAMNEFRFSPVNVLEKLGAPH